MNTMRAQAEPTMPESSGAGRNPVDTVIAEVAERLTEPAKVSALWEEDALFDVIPSFGAIPMAPAHSLTEGLAGTAVLFAEMGRQDPQAQRRAHAHLSAAVELMPASGPSGEGLWGGLPSLAAAALTAATAPHHYRGMLATLDERILHRTRVLLSAEQARLETGLPLTTVAAFDAIGGLTGVGRYLLGGHVLAGHDAHRDMVAAICRYLVRLSEPISARGTALPGWYTLPADQQAEQGPFPPGVIDAGAAHGIAGPLSLLATARRAGITVPGHEEAASRIAEWLLQRQRNDEYGCYWKGKTSPEEELNGPCGGPPLDRVGSWCYGTTGIARALQLAGRTFSRPEWERSAVAAQRAVFEHPPERLELPDASLCHGLGGLLTGTVLIARDSGDPLLTARASELAQSVVALFDPGYRFGYQHIPLSDSGTVVADRPGLLEGAAGVVLALREYATTDTTGDREPGALGWTALLMLD
ncbi:MAG: lanthionine synthetase C family protein [Streptomycetaceae bacterium]|nr:lanthionine synthetase C family protein [Streptomycetaceae bacterium]